MKKSKADFIASFKGFIKKRRNHAEELNLLKKQPNKRSVKPLPDIEPTEEDLKNL